jgi:hypothetical protein
MSQEEQDAIVGRVIREKSEALKRRAALQAEIKLVGETCVAVFRRADLLTAESAIRLLEPIRKYFNLEAFSSLLNEKERAQAEIEDKARQLKDLGVTE